MLDRESTRWLALTLLQNSTSGLGSVRVSGRRRVPKPACMQYHRFSLWPALQAPRAKLGEQSQTHLRRELEPSFLQSMRVCDCFYIVKVVQVARSVKREAGPSSLGEGSLQTWTGTARRAPALPFDLWSTQSEQQRRANAQIVHKCLKYAAGVRCALEMPLSRFSHVQTTPKFANMLSAVDVDAFLLEMRGRAQQSTVLTALCLSSLLYRLTPSVL